MTLIKEQLPIKASKSCQSARSSIDSIESQTKLSNDVQESYLSMTAGGRLNDLSYETCDLNYMNVSGNCLDVSGNCLDVSGNYSRVVDDLSNKVN